MMSRAYYEESIPAFLRDDETRVLGELTLHHLFDLDDLQKNAWREEIRLLKHCLSGLSDGSILFGYTIPRMGKRVDVVLLRQGLVLVLEFKVGEREYTRAAADQVMDYALDLKNFHEQSHGRMIFPVVVATNAPEREAVLTSSADSVFSPLFANQMNLRQIVDQICNCCAGDEVELEEWSQSVYKPTPTIIEAAQALYHGHSVKEISRSDSGAINLSRTSKAISDIIEASKRNNWKSICFVTGVPGSGKTLAGLNLANERHDVDAGEHAVFLSGNGPLVKVLQEALARNEVLEKKGTDQEVSKKSALSHTKAFIQNIHHFRDDALQTQNPPIERVVVFDEAQRAWTQGQTSSFMKTKKGIQGFNQSEPEFLLSVMDRHEDWTIVVCLVGGGQEINTGEAGLPEWFRVLGSRFPHWKVYLSERLTGDEYTRGVDLFSLLADNRRHLIPDLHLSVSVRSFRSEQVSELVRCILDCEAGKARTIFETVCEAYPIVLTRNFETAKEWLRGKARGSERTGILASSGAYRLRPCGVNVKAAIDPRQWFLNGKDDIRSSFFLEEVATEFDIQGLELDWACVAWDANLCHNGEEWDYRAFRGTDWQNVSDESRRLYLKNAYRVLLTRARQGMVIFVPEGDQSDKTREPAFYDSTFDYLESIGIPVI